LVGVDTPTADEAALLQKLAEGFGDGSATTNPSQPCGRGGREPTPQLHPGRFPSEA